MMLQYNSYNASSGQSAYLASLALEIEDTAVYDYTFGFRMYRDPGYSTRADRIEVYQNTTNNLDGTQVLMGTINRSTSLAPIVTGEGWYEYSYILPQSAAGLYYVILKAVSEYGNKMFVDNIVLSRTVKLPLMEDFESHAPPALPPAYSNLVSSTSTTAYVKSYNNANYSSSGTNYLVMYNSSDANADLRFISPEITTGVANARISFSARASDGYILQIGTMNSKEGAFTLFQNISLSAVYQDYSISMGSYSGSDKFIAIKHGMGGTYRSIYLDDIQIETLRNRDLRAKTFNRQAYCFYPDPHFVSLKVENRGKLAVTGFRVRLIDQETGSEITGINETSSLPSGSSRDYDLSFTPAIDQPQEVYAHIQYVSDDYQEDNSTEVEILSIYPADTYQSNIGNHASYNAANTMPFNFYWKNNVSEVVMLEHELRVPFGNIEGICLPYSFVQELRDQPLKVWMKNTDATNLNSGWLASSGYTLVFDSTADFSSGQNLLYLPLNSPFQYNGQNLALRFNRPMDIRFYNAGNHFLYSADPVYPSRSRSLNSDSIEYDPLNPASTGTLSNSIPVMSLVISGVILNIPQPVITATAQDIELNWDEVRGADRYLLYIASEPDDWPEEAQEAISETNFTEPLQSARFYLLKAEAQRQPTFEFARILPLETRTPLEEPDHQGNNKD